MRQTTIEKYRIGFERLKSIEKGLGINRKQLTAVSRKYFGSFVVLHYLRKQGALDHYPKDDAYRIKECYSPDDLIELFIKEQAVAGSNASKKYRLNKKLQMNSETKNDLTATLEEMNNIFSSNEFGFSLRKRGNYEKLIQHGLIPNFLKKNCQKYNSSRMWQKKAETKISVPIFNKPDSFDIAKQLVAQLRGLGYTVTCKKITEIEI